MAEAVHRSIATGGYRPDRALPTETQLAHTHRVGRGTARAAYLRLAEQGVVESVHGHGWYIREDRRVRFPLTSVEQGRATAPRDPWLTLLGTLGRDGGARLDTVDIVTPPPKVATLLRLDRGDRAVMRRRVRYVEGEPWMLSTLYVPADIAEGTPLAVCADMQNPSAVGWLIRNGHRLVRDVDLIEARMPDTWERDVLGIGRGTPLITNHRTSTDQDGRPVRCTVDLFPAHRFELEVEQCH